MEILKMGEATHGSDFQIMRRNGYPVYLLLLVKTPALFETEDGWKQTPADTAILFRPGQRHSYRAAGESYTDCWMHIQSASPLPFDGFPFGQPIPMRQAKERFYPLFDIILGEFFSAHRTKESVISSLTAGLIEMFAAEVETKGPLFPAFLRLRERVFRAPERDWRADDAAHELGVSKGYFHVLYRQYFLTTFVADVITARIQQAEELLASTPESVERIAERCGYNNIEHFTRQFRSTTGISPGRYRKQASKI